MPYIQRTIKAGRTKKHSTRLQVGMEVVRTPQTIYGTDDDGKNIHRPMRGMFFPSSSVP